MNPWHDLPTYPDLDDGGVFNVVVEIPKRSRVKYRLDKTAGLLRAQRIGRRVVYPANYGFVPQTYSRDGDPLDALVLGREAVHPLAILRAKAIGLVRMTHEGLEDDKILAVQVDDPDYSGRSGLDDLPAKRQKKIRRFFERYLMAEEKLLRERGVLDAGAARLSLTAAVKLYHNRFPQPARAAS